jgi:aspartate aminotransferase
VAEFTQYAAIDALRDRDGTTPRMVAEFARRREQFIQDLNEIPGFRSEHPEGAFYAWVDIRGTGASAEEVCRILLDDAGVAAIPGAAFGASGRYFVRFSFASSVENLREAAARIMKVSATWQRTLVER